MDSRSYILLKALLSLQSTVCGEDTGSAAATDGDNTPATGTRDPADVTIAWNETHADGTQGTQADGIHRDDVYTRLMAVRNVGGHAFGYTTAISPLCPIGHGELVCDVRAVY